MTVGQGRPFHAIVGSRTYPHLDEVERFVRALPKGSVIVSGGARGVDRRAESAAERAGLNVISIRPSKVSEGVWAIERLVYEAREGRWRRTTFEQRYPSFAAAAYVRNGFIVEAADQVHAFWDGHSRGTEDTIHKASAARKLAEVVRP